MEPDYKTAITLIRKAQLISSSEHNSLQGIASGSARKALTAARELFHASIAPVFEAVQTIEIHRNNYLLEQAIRSAFSQHKMSLDLLTVTWPQISHSQTANEAVRILTSAAEGDTPVQEMFSVISQIQRTERLFARTVVAGALLEQAANLLNIDTASIHIDSIRRSITFPPEFKQAGIAVLSYFSEVLNSKYPDINVGVTIEQKGERVTLIIDTPAGERERVEQELKSYGLVVTGNLSPEDFMGTPQGAIALKHKLELTALEVRHTRELLMSERAQYGEHIRSLEDQTRMLRDLLDKDRYLARDMASQLQVLASQVASNAENALRAIIRVVEKGVESADIAELKTRLADLEREDAGVFAKVEELIIKGAIENAAGNYLYAALQALSRMA